MDVMTTIALEDLSDSLFGHLSEAARDNGRSLTLEVIHRLRVPTRRRRRKTRSDIQELIADLREVQVSDEFYDVTMGIFENRKRGARLSNDVA